MRTLDSNMGLRTSSSEGDIVDADIDLEFGMELGKLKAAIGGDDGEPILDESLSNSGCEEKDQSKSRSSSGRAPPSYRVLEMGFRSPRSPSLSDGVRGIRVDVEKATM